MDTSGYAKMFGMRRVYSVDLQDDITRKAYYDAGFKWVRKYNGRSFEHTLRNPTVGSTLEVFVHNDYACAPLYSRAANKLIWKVCY
jgi:hypothetical protein